MKKLLVIMVMALMLPALAACAGTSDVSEDPPEIQTEEPALPMEEDTQSENGYTEAVAGGPAVLSPEEIDNLWTAVLDNENLQIIVNGEAIDAPRPFAVNGSLMLPLQPIAEALGYTVVDEGSEVIITPGTIVTEGVNSYYRGREAARELSAAPVIQDGTMFVPMEFFQEILSAVASVTDGNIHVDTIVN